jgi:hypothetical protein
MPSCSGSVGSVVVVDVLVDGAAVVVVVVVDVLVVGTESVAVGRAAVDGSMFRSLDGEQAAPTAMSMAVKSLTRMGSNVPGARLTVPGSSAGHLK